MRQDEIDFLESQPRCESCLHSMALHVVESDDNGCCLVSDCPCSWDWVRDDWQIPIYSPDQVPRSNYTRVSLEADGILVSSFGMPNTTKLVIPWIVTTDPNLGVYIEIPHDHRYGPHGEVRQVVHDLSVDKTEVTVWTI